MSVTLVTNSPGVLIEAPVPSPSSPQPSSTVRSSDQARKDSWFRRSWYNHCIMQGDPSCDILEIVRAGEDPVAGVKGTPLVQFGILGQRCLTITPTNSEVENGGGMIIRGDLRVILYDVDPPETYTVAFPAGTGAYWDITQKTYNEHSGRCTLLIREKQGDL